MLWNDVRTMRATARRGPRGNVLYVCGCARHRRPSLEPLASEKNLALHLYNAKMIHSVEDAKVSRWFEVSTGTV
jgi:hypothetical protein